MHNFYGIRFNLHNVISRLCIITLCLYFTGLYVSGSEGGAAGRMNSSEGILQEITVSGTVTEASTGEPLPGVNIYVKGTTIGVVTDLSGRYSITVPSQEAVLVFSYIGYLTQEVEVGEQTVINISLAESLEKLEEVIVVGYGTMRKSDITGSIVSVSEESLREVPTASLNLSLQGRAAGVDIQRTSTRPGAGTQIRIRGNRSLGATNDPLIVVDGIPYEGSINDLNPGDITSVEILKDASSTAIYGSRGSNGVILITTRRGEAGRVSLSLDSYHGITSIITKYEVYDGETFKLMRDISRYGLPDPYLDVELESIELGRSTDWQDLVYKNGFVTSHNLSVSGGTEDTRYSLGVGFYKETTVLPGQAFSRYPMRFTIDQKIGKRITFGLNTMNTLSYTDGEWASPMYWLLAMSPLCIPYDDEGNLIEQPAYPREDAYNPLTVDRTDQWKQQRRRLRTFNSFYGEVQIIEGLKYRLNAGLDFRTDKYGFYAGSDTPFQSGGPNTATIDNGEAWSYTFENLLTYQKTFAERHNFNFTGMFSVQETESSNTAISLSNIAADYVQYYNPSLADEFVPNNNSSYSRWGILSYMARVFYSYDNRYLLTLTGRADGSSRLAEGNKWHYYPALGLGWNIHNESFMQNLGFLSNLKLRLGYGQVSNTAIPPYRTLGGLTRVPYSFGTTGIYGYLVTNLPNTKLGWEFTNTTNIALDFGFLANRFTGSVDLYKQKTSDILLAKTLPQTSGVEGSYLENVGETQNRGIEVTLSANILSSVSGFNWDVDLNYYMNREEIVALQDTSVKRDIGNGWFVGEPIDVIYDYTKIGIWQSNESMDALMMGFFPGQIKLKDLNDDGRITEEDRSVIGHYEPDWIAGMTNRFHFKGFDASVVLYLRVGGTLVSTLHQPNSYLNMLQGRRSGIKVDFWYSYVDSETGDTISNPTNNYPKPDVTYQNPYYGSTLGYFDATYLKVRSINLGWTVPQKWISKTGISSLRVYVTAQNPFKAFFSPYVDAGGLDPEPTGRGGSDTAGLGNRLTVGANTPPTRSILFGINLKL
jgi:TonB-linked SusC/RagA family outer membrane protein